MSGVSKNKERSDKENRVREARGDEQKTPVDQGHPFSAKWGNFHEWPAEYVAKKCADWVSNRSKRREKPNYQAGIYGEYPIASCPDLVKLWRRSDNCSATKCVCADTRSRHIEPMAALACDPVKTQKSRVAFGANARCSRRRKPLAPATQVIEAQRDGTILAQNSPS